MKLKPFSTMMVLFGLLLGSVGWPHTPSPAFLAVPAAATYYWQVNSNHE